MVALPLSPDVTVHCSVECNELEIRLKLHKLFQNHPLLLSPLHPFMPNVVRGVHIVRLVHRHLWVCRHSARCTPQEMLNVHLEVVIGEVAEVLEEFASELKLGGQGKWFLLLEHFPRIGINELPRWCRSMNSFHMEKCSSSTVIILSSLLTSAGPLIVFPSFLGLMFWNRLMIKETNLCTRGRHVRNET